VNHPADTIPPAADAVPPKLATRSANSLALTIGLVAMLGVCAALFVFNPAEHAFYPRCFFHQVTGLHCPGCGGLRAVHQLLHGHWLLALRLNGLAVLALPMFAWFISREIAGRHGGIRGWWIWSCVATLVVFTVLRNLPAFTFLAP
jgi:hypothetical protein